MCLALCQINSIAGNVDANLEKILGAIELASRNPKNRILVFPELALPGACAGDLLLNDLFLESCEDALTKIDTKCRDLKISAIVGTISPASDNKRKNSLCIVGPHGGAHFDKVKLTSEDVSDEYRYFKPDEILNCIWLCPDSGQNYAIAHWSDRQLLKRESFPSHKVDRIILVGACAFEVGAPAGILAELREIARTINVPVAFVNAVGAGDHIVYAGGSTIVMPNGTVPVMGKWFAEDMIDWSVDGKYTKDLYPAEDDLIMDPVRSTIEALTLGLKDYMDKCGFKRVLIGNSGGIDSAVAVTLSVRALGAENVLTVSMPGPFTTDGTRMDSDELADNLGITQMYIPIAPAYEAFNQMMLNDNERGPLKKLFGGDKQKVSKLAGENLQARLRGVILMWISNALGSAEPTLLLATGNKSEAAVGYTTLYGDTCGGLCLLGDLTKDMVYKVAAELNRQMGPVIPESVIKRAPSAELAPGQKDQDTLPPYPILDKLIEGLLVQGDAPQDLIDEKQSITKELAERVVKMMRRAEYKRKQFAPNIRVTSKAFGFGHRMPSATGKN